MSEAEYVMCKWKNRLWPAKVLPKRNGSKRRPEPENESTFLRVEIFSLNKQADVRFIDTQPLKEETVKDIAAKLAERQPKHCKGTEELVYRRALREALIILNQCAEPGGFRSRGRRERKSGQKTPLSLAAYHEHLSFPEGPPEKEGRAKVTEMPSFPEIMLSKTENPSDLTASPKCQPPMSELQEIPSDRHCASSEEPEILAELYTDDSILRPSKEAKKHLQVGESPSLSILASPNTYVGLTPSGQNVECQPGQGKASPVAQGSPNRTHRSLSHRGAEKDPDGGQDSGSPPGAFQKEPSTISPTCLKSQDGHHPAALTDHVVSQPSKKFKMTTRITQCSEATCPRGHHEILSLSRGPPESSVPKATTEENQDASPEMRLTRPQDFEESPLALPQRLSPRGETHHCLTVKDDDEDDDELPRILWYEEAPPPLEPGMLVWCKLRRFPYWPAVVKSIKRKAKKANVVLIEKDATEKKAKGFSIPLRNLKHFDCKEKQILINEAKEKYRDEIIWSINFIIDYRIKVAGEAFVGSFLDYFASDSICKDSFHPLYQVSPYKVEETEESQSALGATDGRESPLETSPSRPAKKLLPDRSRAARDKANERIVDFIVKARRADGHLWAVLRQEKESRWLREFLAARPYYTCTETYLEDEGQQEQVLGYLRESFEEASSKMLLPRHAGGGIKFILDVMFPEAVIWAISAVDNLDYKTAEAKYLRGPLVSQRERKEFEEEILEKKRELEQRAGFLSPL